MSQVRAGFRFTLLVVTVLGGLQGVVISLKGLVSASSQGFGKYLLVSILLVVYAYVTTAGVIFWKDPNETRPLKWALAIQIPWISLPGFVYKFVAGLHVFIGFIAEHHGDRYSAGLNWKFNLGSSCEFRLFQGAPIEIGVNVAAFAALFFLNRKISSTRANLETGSVTLSEVPREQL
jgi:hypothetical protein